jgi:hypothetical protein
MRLLLIALYTLARCIKKEQKMTLKKQSIDLVSPEAKVNTKVEVVSQKVQNQIKGKSISYKKI